MHVWGSVQSTASSTVQSAVFNKIMEQSYDFHSTTPGISDMVHGADTPAKFIQNIALRASPNIVELCFTIIGLAYFGGLYATVSQALIVIILTIFHSSAIHKLDLEIGYRYALKDKMKFHIRESIDNWRTVKSFGGIEAAQNVFKTLSERVSEALHRVELAENMISDISSLITHLGQLLILAILADQAEKETLSIVGFSIGVHCSKRIQILMKSFTGQLYIMGSQSQTAEKTVCLLSSQPSVQDSPGATLLKTYENKIEFHNVTFKYPRGRMVFRGLSFCWPCGKTIALVGETDSGKSTIVSLLQRYYDPDEGSITIDGQDIRNIKQSSLHEAIGEVPQNVQIFRESIMDNIRYANRSASDDDVYEACKLAQLRDTILKFENGYETVASPDMLSGGTKQRLGLARMRVQDSPIWVLDEATSSVDGITERKIYEGLRPLMNADGRTTIIIAHRLSTIECADIIMALRDGQVVEYGTHDELMKLRGYYYSLRSSVTSNLESEI
ncbi:hypothetical protein PISL3812_10026 [Talaromyces islandicus]|uniref:Uncharacterized protein n=1 Tax=Talaromyces islandicus TaxID=28573 RepID=A0A0U1MBF2_TALIS|nr:hypothetical protein PISL3812_10026 [Talaromyces islandicus]